MSEMIGPNPCQECFREYGEHDERCSRKPRPDQSKRKPLCNFIQGGGEIHLTWNDSVNAIQVVVRLGESSIVRKADVSMSDGCLTSPDAFLKWEIEECIKTLTNAKPLTTDT
jgi:hypothetical protein